MERNCLEEIQKLFSDAHDNDNEIEMLKKMNKQFSKMSKERGFKHEDLDG
jgi:hypothetical protein